MMDAIINGLMSLEYEQIFLTRKKETILESELMIIPACLFSCELLSSNSCLAFTSW